MMIRATLMTGLALGAWNAARGEEAAAPPAPANMFVSMIRATLDRVKDPTGRQETVEGYRPLIEAAYRPVLEGLAHEARERTTALLVERLVGIAEEAGAMAGTEADDEALAQAQAAHVNALTAALKKILSEEAMARLKTRDAAPIQAKAEADFARIAQTLALTDAQREALAGPYRSAAADLAALKLTVGAVPKRGLLTPLTGGQIGRVRALLKGSTEEAMQAGNALLKTVTAPFLDAARKLLTADQMARLEPLVNPALPAMPAIRTAPKGDR